MNDRLLMRRAVERITGMSHASIYPPGLNRTGFTPRHANHTGSTAPKGNSRVLKTSVQLITRLLHDPTPSRVHDVKLEQLDRWPPPLPSLFLIGTPLS